MEKFSVYYKEDDQWKPFIQESTIGYKRLLHFDPITTAAIKIEIESSRLNPAIAEAGVYFDARPF